MRFLILFLSHLSAGRKATFPEEIGKEREGV